MKKILKKFIPKFLFGIKNRYQTFKLRKKYLNKSQKTIFAEIYKKNLWSPNPENNKGEFYSGIGSHSEYFTKTYVEKVTFFLSSFSKKPNVVDLGCGDFSVGVQLRDKCNQYTAIDIVDELIDRNKIKYKNLNVEFKSKNITSDNLPEADICFLRQVLQHMSNDSIQKFIINIKDKYRYLVITEHYPPQEKFIPNVDKPTGPDIRIYEKSAVVLTEAPFSLKVIKEEKLCELFSDLIEGSLVTHVLRLKT